VRTRYSSICVIGLGYIGLPTAAAFAARKVKVIGVDVSQRAVDTVNQGRVHIVEPDLDILVQAVVSQGYLRATTEPEAADAFLIAVPTPFKENREPDLKYIEAAAKSVAGVLKRGDLVVLESTSPVGATETMARWLAEARPDLTFPQQKGERSDIRIAHCPERVLPGQIIRELVENDRVIGGMTKKCSQAAAELYKTFVRGECILTDARTAEMCKLTENAFRDVNIAFANELSLICDKLGINVWELIKLANRHPRVNILKPGPGVGGHCIAVDPWFIVHSSPQEARLVHCARLVNESKPAWVIGQVDAAVRAHMQSAGVRESEVKIAALGLSFKADIDDLRESPALDITRSLAQRYRGQVVAVEPNIEKLPGELIEAGVSLVALETAIRSAHVLALLVDHRQFRECGRPSLDGKRIVDTRGLWHDSLRSQ
jgi:UDP-N-acetyl-D-mannosaminuronic acid dehydrogenase